MPGVAFPPVGPVGLGSPPSSGRGSAQTASSPSRGRSVLPLLPRSLGSRLWFCVSCLRKARVRGGRLLATPGVFTSAVGTPTPDMTPGDHGSPQCPSHPCASLPRSQPPVVSWTRALAQPGLRPAGHCTPAAFPSLPREDDPVDHDSPYCGAPSRGLLPRSFPLRTPLTGGARGVHS